MIELLYGYHHHHYTPNGGKNKRVWTKEEDAMLVDSLMKLRVSGKYVNADIEPEYVNAVLGLMDPNVVSSAKPVKNRMKLLKTHFDIVHDMVGKIFTGFCWDPQSSRVVAEDRVWDEYIKTHPDAAQFRNRSFPHYDKLCVIFGKDKGTCVQENGVGVGGVEEDQVSPRVETKDLHADEDAGSTNGAIEGVSRKRKRDEGKELSETCVESLVNLQNVMESFLRGFVVSLEAGASDTMDKVMTQMGDLSGLTLDERLVAMSVIGRSAPLSKMFDRLDVDGKFRMAQMVANGSIK